MGEEDTALTPFGRFEREFEDMFRMMDSFWGPRSIMPFRREWLPRTDVEETDNAYIMTVDVPGYKKDQIDIEVEGRTISIAGKVSEEKEKKEKKYHCRERFKSSFRRSMTLPHHVSPEEIKASLKDGVLRIEIPKSESSEKRKVTIE